MRVTLGGRARATVTAALAAALLCAGWPPAAEAAPATHYAVSAPASATAGTAFSFTVTAQDVTNMTDTSYAGTVHFSSSDPSATLPANSTLTNGVMTFSATLRTAGPQTITATEAGNVLITGTSGPITVSSNAATHFSVSAPGSVTAGSAFNFDVTARDQFNNTATGYAGTVHFTSSDGSATLPVNSTLTNGTKTFSATLRTEGIQTITATDTVTSSISGTSNGVAVSTATHLLVSAPASSNPGSAFGFTVTALNADGSVDSGYLGTVRLTSSDGEASMPLDSALSAGRGMFQGTLRTTGTQTVVASDVGNPSVADGVAQVAVRPSNAFSVEKLKRNTRNGTATLIVHVPGPGNLTLKGTGVQAQRPFARRLVLAAARKVSGAGNVKLTIAAKGNARKRLNRTGKVKVKPKMTFVPTGGVAARQSISVTLKKQLRH
jgi:hypothetical protein